MFVLMKVWSLTLYPKKEVMLFTEDVKKIEIPFGSGMGGTCTAKKPCTLNGFTGSAREIIPEWTTPDEVRLQLKDGAELHWVCDGEDQVLAVYDGKCFSR